MMSLKFLTLGILLLLHLVDIEGGKTFKEKLDFGRNETGTMGGVPDQRRDNRKRAYTCSSRGRIRHLCIGDKITCVDLPDPLGGWTATKTNFCNGWLTQIDRRVILEDRNKRGLPCNFQECKFDFTCKRKRREDAKYRAGLTDKLCLQEALESSDPGVRQRAEEETTNTRVTNERPQPRAKRSTGSTDRHPSPADPSGNLFIKTHDSMFGPNSGPICYNPESVLDMFTVSPLWGRTETVVKCLQGPTQLPERVVRPYHPFTAPPANCLPLPRDNTHSHNICVKREPAYPALPCIKGNVCIRRRPVEIRHLPCNFTSNRDNRTYERCFTNQDWGCTVVSVSQTRTCVKEICQTRRCQLQSGAVTCPCTKSVCVNLNKGLQIACGQANGTHLQVNESTFFPITHHRDKWISREWWDWATGGETPNSWSMCSHLYTTTGYFFFYNGTATNVLEPPYPRQVAVGTLVPTTVPCPTKWEKQKNRLVKRAATATKKYCGRWNNPKAFGGVGHSVGWGILSSISLGGSAGGIAADNRNYLVCGLTILGNATKGALGEVTSALQELRLFTQQNRYALDYLLAKEGGVCAIIKETCIMGVTDRTRNLTKFMDEIQDFVEGMGEGPSGGNWEVTGWQDWFINIAIYLGIILLCIFVGLAVLKCILARMMRSVGSIGDTVDGLQNTQKMMLQRLITDKGDDPEEQIKDGDAWLIEQQKKETIENEYRRLNRTNLPE